MKLTKGKVISALLALLLVLVALFPIPATSESGTEEQAAIEITIPDEEPPEEPEAIQIELDANDDEPAQEEIPEIEVSLEEPEDDLPDEEEPADELVIEDIQIAEEAPEEPVQSEEPAQPEEEPADLAGVIAAHGYAYAVTAGETKVYGSSEWTEDQHVFTIAGGQPLLATACIDSETHSNVKVWFITGTGEAMTGYVPAQSLEEAPHDVDEANAMAAYGSGYVDSEAGILLAFVVLGEFPQTMEEAAPDDMVAEDIQIPDEEESAAIEVVLPDEQEDEPIPAEPETTEEHEEIPDSKQMLAEIGDFAYVTTNTRAFMEVDESAADDYYGDYFLGYFLKDAAVQVEDVLTDFLDRTWYSVSYIYGPDEGDGLTCEIVGMVYVLAEETAQTDLDERTATDYGYPPDYMRPMLLSSFYVDLEDHNGGVASFYVGESGLYATTGHDNEYKQIARHDEYGTIFATPHYLKGETAYCLEHTQPSPVVRDHASGPYQIVDLDGYKVTPGHSGYIFSDKTMHALAWVLRHTYPFMVLDRSDSDNEVWCRVAGQFAMREVIKQLEGDFYIMDYWEMDEFYRAYDQAPGVYLDYARWLAEEALAYVEDYGNVTVSNKSVSASGGKYIGTATLYTSADRLRISTSVGTVSGHTGGSDGEYYYVYSGDTISITSSKSKFSVPIEIMPSADDEARFYVGVTYEDIQKLVLPVYGEPYPILATSLDFEVPHGSVTVSKKSAQTGALLPGAVFELLSSSGSVVQTQTTGANGTATFSNLTPGTYSVREKTAPQGYLLSATSSQNVTVTAGVNAQVSFSNEVSKSKIRIIKTDSLTGDALPGAEFTITRLSAPSGGSGVGSVAAVLTTGADGTAETGWLEWGRYRIEETKVPEHYEDSGFVTEIDAYENGRTYEFSVKNTPVCGYIQLTKTDAERGIPLSGVQFDIYHDDVYGSGLADSMTTDADGIARSGPLRKGTYLVKEHANPEGYTGELTTLDAVVKPDETSELEAENQPIQGKIRIVKTDELTGEALAGAEFTITRIEASPAANDAGIGETTTITTDESGIAETGWLDYGTYRITETVVPEHFVDSGFSVEVDVHEDQQTYTVDVQNEPTKGYIQIVKTDSLDQTPIEGVQFDIYYNDEYGEGLAATMTTNADGVAVSERLRKGRYIVREHDNPTGYVSDLVELNAAVKSDETTYLSAENEPIQGQIRIVKTDELTGEALAGAEFTITRISGLPSHKGAGDGDVAAVLTTDSAGIAVSPLLTWGVYRVEETKVPEHFVDNGFSVDVTIDAENMQTYEVAAENEPTKGYIQIVKTDSLDHMPIEGVQFDIYYNDEYGEGLAATMTTNADGVAVSQPLRKGRYIVREHDNPTGYVSELVELNAAVESDKTTYLSAENEPIQGQIRIVKTDGLTGEALAGAEFTITRVSGLPSHKGAGNGDVVAVLTTDSAGIAVSPLLTWGVYRVEETKVPEHFVDNSFSTEVIIDVENMQTYEVAAENEPTKGYIRITKTDRVNGNPISGVRFDVYYNDQYGEGLATSMVTDENGVAVSEPIRKGRYIVRESGATTGYHFDEITLDATVRSDETTELAATNMPVLVKLRIYKRDAGEMAPKSIGLKVRGDGILTEAEFQVLAAEDIVDRQGNVVHPAGSIVVDSIVTEGDDAAALTDNLWPGLYEIVEVTPPEGYHLSSEPIIVDARSAAQQSEEAVIVYEGTKSNEIMTGAQAIVKILGSGDHNPDPDRVEIPEPGAEFEVYLKRAGSYENARDIERDYLMTDENGYARTKELPYGVYVLRQTVGKDGYELKSAIEFKIDGTEDLIHPPIMTLSDRPILYRLRLIKTDAKTGKVITLPGASFKLKDADGNFVRQTVYYPTEREIDTFTTDDSGAVTLPETVGWGLYFIEEVKAPQGYLIRDQELAVFVGRDGDTPDGVYELDIEIPNDPVSGRIVVHKKGLQMTGVHEEKDEYGNTVYAPVFEERYLAGAEFEVRAAEDIVGGDGTIWYQKDELVDTITTTEEGGDTSRELPLGRYVLIETQMPDGYVGFAEHYEVDLAYADDHTAVVEISTEIHNAYLPAQVSLTKVKEITQTAKLDDLVKQEIAVVPGEGFVFGLYVQNDIPYSSGTLMADTLVATGATETDGKLILSGMFPHGDYYLKELSAPDGWKMSAERYPIQISAENRAEDQAIICVGVEEPILNRLVYTPVTLTKTDITGENTVPGALIVVRNSEGEIVYQAYTDENGEIPDMPLTPGDYTFREILAPEGYELNVAEMAFTVHEDGTVTGDTSIRDDFTRVQLIKHDENGRPLADTQFILSDESGRILKIEVSDENGLVTFERIPYGTFVIEESRPLNGYLPSSKKVTITVTGAFINPSEPLDTFVNYPNEAVIRKVDQKGKALPGAVFGLFDENGKRKMTAVSDEKGIVRFTKIPHGDFTIREIEPPNGYLLCKEVVNLTIDDSYVSSDTPIATLTNHLKRVRYQKVDTSGKYLPGVEFSLINAATGEVVETVVSDDHGEFVFTKFDYGDWIIRETKAPEGFNRMDDLTLHVDENWKEPEPFTCVNIPNHYEFIKTDNRRNPIPSVKFALEDGNFLRELVSGDDGIVRADNLTPGKYVIRETEAAEGYTKTDEVIEITIDENYVPPKRLKRLKNYSTIQTGVDIEMTPVMWAGAGLMAVTAVVMVVYAVRSRKHRK